MEEVAVEEEDKTEMKEEESESNKGDKEEAYGEKLSKNRRFYNQDRMSELIRDSGFNKDRTARIEIAEQSSWKSYCSVYSSSEKRIFSGSLMDNL